MNRLKATLVLFLLAYCSFGQSKIEDFPSRQEKDYKKQKHYLEFQPQNVVTIRRITYDHVRLRTVDTNNKFVTFWERTTYQKYFDSLEQICLNKLWKVIGTPQERHLDWEVGRYLKYYDSLEKLGAPRLRDTPQYKQAVAKCDKCLDSVRDLIHHYTIAGVESERIRRYDSLGTKRILIYEEFRMTDLEPAFWVAISTDYGKTWNRYFTGLVENNFYYLKPNPTIRLIKDDSTIQIEVATVRQMEEWARPGVGSENMYQLVDDNLVAELTLNKLVADSDHDGFTDLLEKRLYTNPFSRDTDGDGIDDALDSNPRFKSVTNKYSNLFLFLLESGSRDSTFIPFEHFEPKPAHKDTSTYFIITDNKNILGLGKTSHRFIFLTTKEASEYKKRNYGGLREISISPLFEIDDMPGVKKVDISYGFAGSTYLIIERQDGWLVKVISSWII